MLKAFADLRSLGSLSLGLFVALSLSFAMGAGGPAVAAPSEPEETPAAKPAECKEADKTKCPQPVAEDCKEADKSKCPKQQSFLERYRAAMALVDAKAYDRALIAMSALDDGTSPDVITMIGFIKRKTGHMAEAQMYYEAALHMEPTHRGALEYYGEWFVQMGNLPKARDHLARLADLYGTGTPEYRALADMIEAARG